MKKTFTFLMLGILTSTLVIAQDLELGIKGGLNIPASSVAIGNDDPNLDIVKDGGSGYHAGLFAKFKIAMFAINPEVLYSFQTTEFSVKDLNSTITQDLSYLTVPVIVRFYLPFGLNFHAGPQFGFNLDAVQTVDLGGNVEEQALKQIKGSDIGLNLGLGFDLPFGLDIHGRYVVGLTDVNDVQGAVDAARNSMIQISLAYSLKK